MTDYTLYTSPYMVMTDNEYTKHYYVEADRVASKIGGGMANNITDINDVVIGFEMQSEENYLQKNNDVLDMMTNDFNELEVHASIEVYTNTVFWEDEALGQNGSEGDLIYFFHKDHLGSSTQISDISANIIHHIEYMPYGETFVEQRSNWGTNYKFNGKELDEETGFYYYGARYYNPDISIWLSVDPLSDKYPSLSPYNYCVNNPIMFVDPDGKIPLPVVTGAIGGVIGGLVSGGISAIRGESWKDVGKAAVGGFVGGFIVGSGAGLIAGTAGITTAGALGITAVAGGLSGAATSITTQGIEIALDERSGIDGMEVITDVLIGIPANLIGSSVANAATSKIKKEATNRILEATQKTATKEFQNNIKKELRANPMLSKKQINQIAKQTIKAINQNNTSEINAVKVSLQGATVVGVQTIMQTTTNAVDKRVGE